MSASLQNKADELLELARKRGVSIATAESCTGGLVAGLLTDVPGSSDVFERGFVTYSNQSKTDMLGVDAALIRTHGAVSEQVAKAMAEGALAHSSATLSVAITGIAGPGGGSAEKPVGTVHIATAMKGKPTLHQKHAFSQTAGRQKIRQMAATAALEQLLSRLS